MKFFSSAVILSALSGLSLALPQPAQPPSPPSPPQPPFTGCLNPTTASNLVNGFASLLTNYNVNTANALLASDFTDTSDSINFLAGYPLGSTTFPSKAAFEAGQGSQPAIGFNVLNIDAVTCTVIAFRWEAILGSQPPVKGINILYASNLNHTNAGWQIETVYSEFNSGTWSQEIGGVCA